ncbi:MAG TPA: glycogen synthase GlgA [Candidatus Omnitrophica bacterium]|nr:glycogen synthase GlgA [Candidatus Omnitrophota bacterium]
MKILFVASEVSPFAKTGGLADVAGSLPRALARLGHEVRLIMPRYRAVDPKRFRLKPRLPRFTVPLGSSRVDGSVFEGVLPGTKIPAHFVDQPDLFDRDGLYQYEGRDFPDNLARFSFFSRAVLDAVPRLGWPPDVVHCHDWQTALIIAHLALARASDPFWQSAASVLTVHNLAYQGVFPQAGWPLTGLPSAAFSMEGLEFYGQINCLKGGLVHADRLSTVSPTYAKEIQTPAGGCGLDGILVTRRGALVGILNGIDVDEWNPQTDPHLAARYAVDRLEGKATCKRALQRQQRLPARPAETRAGGPQQPALLIGMIQRLVEQKGLDLFVQAAPRLMTLPIQVVILGVGDPAYHQQLTDLARRFPDRMAVTLRFAGDLAYQIEAGADAFLMPSRFEPCGLNQMYSMRYGTLPIVHRTGGLADTVVDATPSALAAGRATGFIFEDYSAEALVEAVEEAVALFANRAQWTQVMRTGMRQDFSWDRSAREYVTLYETARSTKHPRPAERTGRGGQAPRSTR